MKRTTDSNLAGPPIESNHRQPSSHSMMRRVHRMHLRLMSLIDQDFAGSYDSAFKGAGIEFLETRPYQPGDDVRSIDWRVTARTGTPYIRLFRQERQLALHLLVDVSPSTIPMHAGRSVRDCQIEVASLLALIAVRQGDRVGLSLFSDRMEKTIPVAGGTQHALRLISEMLTTRVGSHQTNLSVPLRQICKTEKRRGLIVLLSDFLSTGYERSLRMAAVQHELLPIWVADPADQRLPRWGMVCGRDPETGQQRWIDAFSRRQRAAYQESFTQFSQRLKMIFGRLDVPWLRLDTRSDVAAELRRFFYRRGAER